MSARDGMDSSSCHLPTTRLAADLTRQIAALPCINSHSHILPEEVRLQKTTNVLDFFGEVYLRSDLLAAGMAPETLHKVLDRSLPLLERWELLEPYWRFIRLTGYARCISEALHDLFECDELSRSTLAQLSEQMAQQARPGFYTRLLKDKCRIERSLMNMGWAASKRSEGRWDQPDFVEVDRSLFVPLPRLNRFNCLSSRQQILGIESRYDTSLRSLEDLIELIEQICSDWVGRGIAGLKLSHSNHRPLNFVARERKAARAVFDSLLRGEELERESEGCRLLEDFLVFECCRIAAQHQLAVQFHTGMRAADRRSLEGASVTAMVPLFKAFPKARFDLSHSSFPYLREAAILAKTFPNVFLNMAWIHIISPAGVRQGLREWLEMVPINKIVAFGDDLQHVELVCGHLKIARQNVAAALAGMIEDSLIGMERALEVARMLFYENPRWLYRLDAALLKELA